MGYESALICKEGRLRVDPTWVVAVSRNCVSLVFIYPSDYSLRAIYALHTPFSTCSVLRPGYRETGVRYECSVRDSLAGVRGPEDSVSLAGRYGSKMGFMWKIFVAIERKFVSQRAFKLDE